MITITMERDGRKYELVPNGDGDCHECTFCLADGRCCEDDVVCEWNDYVVCCDLDGVWKEVTND